MNQHQHEVQVLQIDHDAVSVDRARPTTTFTIAANTDAAARRAALAHLAAEGHTVRSLSIGAGGLVAVVTQPPPSPPPAQLDRARRGP